MLDTNVCFIDWLMTVIPHEVDASHPVTAEPGQLTTAVHHSLGPVGGLLVAVRSSGCCSLLLMMLGVVFRVQCALPNKETCAFPNEK